MPRKVYSDLGGLPLLGLPVSYNGHWIGQSVGNVFFVDSGNTNSADNASTSGRTPDNPFATVDYAIGNCTANNGDVIIGLPGHTETITAAAGCVFDVAGVTFIGLGTGSDRATFNFTTAVGADLDIDAANVTIFNALFTGGIDALTGPIDVNAADCRLINIETKDVTGQATDFIVADANADRLLIDGWTHRGAAAAGADTALTGVGGDDVSIQNFNIYGNFAVAGIENVTTAGVRWNVGGLSRHRNMIWTANAADVAVTMKSDTTGWIDNINAMLTDNAANITEAFTGAAMQFGNELYVCNLAGERVVQSNITASTDA